MAGLCGRVVAAVARVSRTVLIGRTCNVRGQVRCLSSGLNSHTASVYLNIHSKRREQDDHYESMLLGINQANHRERDNMLRGVLSQKVLVNDTRIHYKTTGTGDHTVLLLPGALGSTNTDFRPQIADLDKDKFTLVAWDPRGYGKSIPPERDWPLHYLQRDAEDAAALMKTINHKSFSLLGWSDGGITALILAARHPEMVRKMIVWGANAYVTDEDVKCFAGIKNIDKWSEKMRTPFIEMYGEEYFRKQWSLWVDAFSRYKFDNEGDICKDDLPKIKCPTLIIHGDKDFMVPEEHPLYLQENIKGSKLIRMPEGKHNLHLRYADQFNHMTTKFLTDDSKL